jgi:hypothetical protein
MTESISFAEAKLSLKAKVWDKMPMTLHSQVGEGTDPKGRKVTVKQPVQNNSVFVEFEGGQTYQVMFYDIISACLNVEKQQSKALVKSAMDESAMELAAILKNYVVQNYPHYRSTMNEAKVAKQIQLLHRQDEAFTYDIIGKVMRWIFEQYQPRGSFDWREQIRSGDKFRKHFPALLDLIRKELGEAQIETI